MTTWFDHRVLGMLAVLVFLTGAQSEGGCFVTVITEEDDGPSCEINGVRVAAMERVDSSCGTCTCGEDGEVLCTQTDCPCNFDGIGYGAGGAIPSPDGCNTCWCGEDGSISCTEIDCGSDAELCGYSGGWWNENSCGDYYCGAAPLCDAIIPGCDCGPLANFVSGYGCVDDGSCGGSTCSSTSECAADEYCTVDDGECRSGCAWEAGENGGDSFEAPDVSCAPVCLGTCESISGCLYDWDCDPGYHCAGSSVCPPDATCVWEGEPGVCVPDDRGCFADAECPPGHVCDGEVVCPEGSACFVADSPGACVLAEPPPCTELSEAACLERRDCMAIYVDAVAMCDCACDWEVAAGATTCSADMEGPCCTGFAGCEPMPSTGCSSDLDCSEGSHCEPSDFACLSVDCPLPGECVVDATCSYRGHDYAPGDRFGTCDECTCQSNGEVMCLLVACDPH
jgi:hypothetical protein